MSALKKYVGFVMAELIVERGGSAKEGGSGVAIDVVVERMNMAIIELDGGDLKLTAKLIKTSESPKIEIEIPRGDVWKRFSAEEVAAFISETNDDNEIHRGARPIVPGFLLAETLLERFGDCKKIRLRFKHFTAVGENLYLTVDGARFYVDSHERKIEGWILDN